MAAAPQRSNRGHQQGRNTNRDATGLQLDRAGPVAGIAPGLWRSAREVLVLPGGGHEGEEDLAHGEEGDTATEVAPPAGGRVRDANDPLREHLGAPDLAGDEGGEPHADDEPARDESSGVRDEHHAEDGWRGNEEDEREALARAHLVADDAHQEAADDVGRDAHKVPHGQLGALQPERRALLQHWRERRGREGAEERGEEPKPRGVEGVHVRTTEGPEGQLGRLVLRAAPGETRGQVSIGATGERRRVRAGRTSLSTGTVKTLPSSAWMRRELVPLDSSASWLRRACKRVRVSGVGARVRAELAGWRSIGRGVQVLDLRLQLLHLVP